MSIEASSLIRQVWDQGPKEEKKLPKWQKRKEKAAKMAKLLVLSCHFGPIAVLQGAERPQA